MFVILLTYVKPLDQIAPHRQAHEEFILHHCAAGDFVMSGCRDPLVGGVILAQGRRREVERIMDDDPLRRAGVADYEMLEFTPSMAAEGLRQYIH